MFVKEICRLSSIKQIYQCLLNIQPNYKTKLFKESLKFVNFDLSFCITPMYYNTKYNVELIQMFDNTRIILHPQSAIICVNGEVNLSMIANQHQKLDELLHFGDSKLVRYHDLDYIIQNKYPSYHNSICILFHSH